MAVRSTQGQNKAVRSTQGARGVSPSYMCLLVFQSPHSDYVTRCYFNVLAREVITVGSLLVFMNKHEAGETNLLPIKSHVQ